jgi:hypothetical protein
MRGVLLVARRELAERRNVFLAAPVASLLPFVAALAPWVSRSDGAEARAIVAFTLAAAFALGTAIVHGATMVGRDLAERRIAFYFAKPLSGLALWGGKTTAGVLLFALPPALILLPATLAGWPDDLLSPLHGTAEIAAVLGGGAFLVAVAHAVGIVVRSRSSWIVADVVALALTALAVWYATRTLLAEAAFTPLQGLVAALLAMVFVTIHVAGAVQVCAGRIDLRRGHRFLSLVLWGSLLPAAALAVAFCTWVVDVSPTHLTEIQQVVIAPSGGATVVAGPARHRGDYHPTFLLDAETGRSVRIGPAGATTWCVFSTEGALVVARSRHVGRNTELTEILVGRIGPDGPSLHPTSIALSSALTHMALSPSASRIATAHAGTLSVWQAFEGRLLASTRLDSSSGVTRLVFVSEKVLRTYRFVPAEADGNAGDVVIDEFDVDARILRTVGTIGDARRFDLIFAHVDAAGERLLWFDRSDAGVATAVRDARTGARLHRLDTPDPANPASGVFLTDGRIATGEVRHGEASLRIFGADGRLQLNVPLGRARWISLGGQPTSRTILVGVSKNEAFGPAGSRTELIDVVDGSRRLVGERILPESARGYLSWLPFTAPSVLGSFASRACRTADGALVEFDPSTWTQRVIVARHRATERVPRR